MTTHTHPTKPKKWIARRYFGKFNKFRNDGSSATAAPPATADKLHTWSSFPGPTSSGTRWSSAGPHLTTPT